MSGDTPTINRNKLLTLVLILAGIYMVSQFLRNSVGVIAPDLVRDLSLRPEELGILSGAFFLSFAAVQLPLGIAIDRWGPRRVLLASSGLAVLGSILFATADTLGELTAARILMGLGCSTFYMAPLALYTRWFPPEKFASAVSFQYGLGNIGTIAATAPLAFAAGMFGWRASFYAVAAMTLIITVIIAMFVRDTPEAEKPQPKSHETLADGLRGVGEVLARPGAWSVFAIHFVGYGAFVTLLGLWGGPYLTDIHQMGLEDRGQVLLVLALSQVLAIFGWGPLDRVFATRKYLVIGGAIAQIIILLVLASTPLPLPWLIGLFIVFGISSAYLPVMTAHGRALFPDRLVGRGLTFMNMGVMGGAFALQSLTGFVAGFASGEHVHKGAPLPLEAYEAVFLFLALTLAVALAIYASAPDRPPRSG